jgi:hypothetical protein
MDPTMVFRMIFGGGTFDDTFGELGMITMMTMVFAFLVAVENDRMNLQLLARQKRR